MLESTELETHKLRRNLGTFDVIVLGVGAMVGAGIFVLTGQAAATEAGPSITLSFALAGVVCALAALCYAELASMVPVAGSAYTYTFATLGQLVAFIIGWDLVLEFTIGAVGGRGRLRGLSQRAARPGLRRDPARRDHRAAGRRRHGQRLRDRASSCSSACCSSAGSA